MKAKVKISKKLTTGTHYVCIDVSFGLIHSANFDRRFTYGRLKTKIKAICKRNGMTDEQITAVTVRAA
jgi:hypothetical protein